LLVERRKVRCIDVVGVGAIAEELEERQIGSLFGSLSQSLDLRCLEQLGEYKGIGMGGGSCDEVGGGAGGRG
jgi:hypothetical protein